VRKRSADDLQRSLRPVFINLLQASLHLPGCGSVASGSNVRQIAGILALITGQPLFWTILSRKSKSAVQRESADRPDRYFGHELPPLTREERWKLYWKQNFASSGAYVGPLFYRSHVGPDRQFTRRLRLCRVIPSPVPCESFAPPRSPESPAMRWLSSWAPAWPAAAA
jgi:hypothetical protein